MTRLGAVALVALLSGGARPLACQSGPVSAPAPRGAGASARFVSVIAGPRYQASGFHRLLFGNEYRELWISPIEVEVLDLRTYAGGLEAVKRGGGMETQTLHLETRNGRKFAFRSVDKTHSQALPPELRGTTIERISQDQTSAQHPAAALIVPPLLEAAGVRTAWPKLFVMPDDSLLGEFRADFGGMLGTLEERPTDETDERPGFEGARKVAETDELYDLLDRDPRERVDARAFLAARLMDLYVGDPDRAEGQWRWIKLDDKPTAPWEPVPYDRDQALIRYEGRLPSFAGHLYPWVVRFGDHYPSILGLSWGSRNLDRRLLGDLDRRTWDSVAHALQQRLTDSVIDAAARRQPAPYYTLDGARLSRALRKRRDRLPEAARRFYRLLAPEAEVYASDGNETVRATRRADGILDLTIRAGVGTPDEIETFHRSFDARETREVRLFLRGGSDTVQVGGTGDGAKLRVIGQKGNKVVIDDAARGWTRVYDAEPTVTVAGSHAPSINRRRYRTPDSTSARQPAPRDWGGSSSLFPWGGSYSSDYGVMLGLGGARVAYGYRRDPYGSRLELRGGYATGVHAFTGEFRGDLRREISGRHFLFDARASGSDVLRFYGLGNATVSTGPDSFYQAHTSQYLLSAAVAWVAYRHVTLQVGPVLKYFSTDLTRATLVGESRPYGAGHFGEVGLEAAISFDSRDTVGAPTRGVRATLGGRLYPPIWSAASGFGGLRAEAVTYLTAAIPFKPTLALRVGGQRVWGTYPFEEAAIIGGSA